MPPPNYRTTVALSGVSPGKENGTNDVSPLLRLAEHLIVLHATGKIGLEEGGLVDRFFLRAPQKVKAHALTFHGQALHKNEELPGDVLQGIQEFVEWRLRVAGAEPNPRDEFSRCAWLFTSGKLDAEWTIQHLLQSLRVNPELEPGHMVADYLCEVVATHPGEVVDCFDVMVHGAQEPWRVDSWSLKAIQALRAARASGDLKAREHAERLANQLVSMGRIQFREALDD